MSECITLKNPGEVRAFLNVVVMQTYAGTLDVKRANCVTATCNVLLQSMRLDDIEKRIEALEGAE